MILLRKYLTDMIDILSIAIIVNLSIIAIQDFLSRKISLLAIISLSCLSIGFFMTGNPTNTLLKRLFVNSILSGLILFSGTLLVKLKNKGLSFGNIIGSGDFLFLISTSPLFSFEIFLVFLNFSFLFTLISFHFYRTYTKILTRVIPLAGSIAITLCLYFGSILFLRYDPFEDLLRMIKIELC